MSLLDSVRRFNFSSSRPKNLCPSCALIVILHGAGHPAAAHCLVGGRVFPSTLGMEEPCVKNELVLPYIASSGVADAPGHRQFEIAGAYSKTITSNLSVGIGQGWARRTTPEGLARGLGAIETGVKYQFLTSPEAEWVMSAGFSVAWGATGRPKVESPRYNVYTPALFAGKGFGDLPFSMNFLRPFAVTGRIGYEIPAWTKSRRAALDEETLIFEDERHPRFLQWGMTIQYSLPYLRQNVHDFDMPDFFNRLIPLVEFSFETPVANVAAPDRKTRGVIGPGFVYAEKEWQFTFEASAPINQSHHRAIGFRGQLHFVLDEILPHAVTKPLIAHFQ